MFRIRQGSKRVQRGMFGLLVFLCTNFLGAELTLGKQLVVEYGPYHLPANRLMIMPTNRKSIQLPKDHMITSIELRSMDHNKRTLPGDFVCHDNVGPVGNNFNHGQKILLDGYTTKIELPEGFGIGVPEEDFLVELMYNNPSDQPMSGVSSRLVLELEPVKSSSRIVIYPQMMSVYEQPAHIAPGHWGYYVLPKTRDKRVRLYDVLQDYKIHYITFHIHEHGQTIKLRNLTTDTVICDARMRYSDDGKITKVPQVSLPKGILAKKGDVLELVVEYDNPTEETIDTMGAAILYGRCPVGEPDCEVIAQRPADNKDFDPEIYRSLLGPGSGHHSHH